MKPPAFAVAARGVLPSLFLCLAFSLSACGPRTAASTTTTAAASVAATPPEEPPAPLEAYFPEDVNALFQYDLARTREFVHADEMLARYRRELGPLGPQVDIYARASAAMTGVWTEEKNGFALIVRGPITESDLVFFPGGAGPIEEVGPYSMRTERGGASAIFGPDLVVYGTPPRVREVLLGLSGRVPTAHRPSLRLAMREAEWGQHALCVASDSELNADLVSASGFVDVSDTLDAHVLLRFLTGAHAARAHRRIDQTLGSTMVRMMLGSIADSVMLEVSANELRGQAHLDTQQSRAIVALFPQFVSAADRASRSGSRGTPSATP